MPGVTPPGVVLGRPGGWTEAFEVQVSAERASSPGEPAAIRACDARPLLNIFGQDECAIRVVKRTIDFLSIEFREENEGDPASRAGQPSNYALNEQLKFRWARCTIVP